MSYQLFTCRIVRVFLVLWLVLLTQGFCQDGGSDNVDYKIKPLIEIKTGYFIFASSTMRKIYDNGGIDVQLCGSYPLWKWLQIYGSIEFLERHGTSINDGQKTNIWEIPVSVGLKPVIRLCHNIHYYVALGPRYFYLHAHNQSSYVNKIITHNGVGGFLNTGFNFFPCKHCLMDIFGEYSYERMHFHSSETNVYGKGIQVGGFSFGLGLGYAF